MTHLLSRLPAGARILDLGAAAGSFPETRHDLCVVRLDLKFDAPGTSGHLVRGDAARLPFPGGTFDLLVSNHSLEHFVEFEAVLREIGRVVKPGGGIYVAVPDASTLTDRIYRWLGRGGGHVNAFRRPAEVIALVERHTGLMHRATCVLYSSLSFLNRRNVPGAGPRKLLLFGNGSERFVAGFIWLLRALDRAFGARLSLYGWEFHFGAAEPGDSAKPWINVCVRCGSGHAEEFLRKYATGWRKFGPLESYRCPSCRGFNWLTPERR